MYEYKKYIHLNTKSLDETIFYLFNSTVTLDFLYGLNNYKNDVWKNNKLKIKYTYPIERIPTMLHYLVGNTNVDGRFKAEKIIQPNGSCLIKAKVIPKVIGSSLIQIKSCYLIYKHHETDGYCIDFNCKIKIYLPEPFNQICHTFLDQTVNEQFSHVLEALQKQNIEVLFTA